MVLMEQERGRPGRDREIKIDGQKQRRRRHIKKRKKKDGGWGERKRAEEYHKARVRAGIREKRSEGDKSR